MMQLKNFISLALTEIIDGVREAQEHVGKVGAQVAPAGFLKGKGTVQLHDPDHPSTKRQYAQIVRFDVGVTASESDSVKGGLGVFVTGLGVGMQDPSESGNTTVSRIKFAVPVQLPTQE